MRWRHHQHRTVYPSVSCVSSENAVCCGHGPLTCRPSPLSRVLDFHNYRRSQAPTTAAPAPTQLKLKLELPLSMTSQHFSR